MKAALRSVSAIKIQILTGKRHLALDLLLLDLSYQLVAPATSCQ